MCVREREQNKLRTMHCLYHLPYVTSWCTKIKPAAVIINWYTAILIYRSIAIGSTDIFAGREHQRLLYFHHFTASVSVKAEIVNDSGDQHIWSIELDSQLNHPSFHSPLVSFSCSGALNAYTTASSSVLVKDKHF